jgi:hypothetical protein
MDRSARKVAAILSMGDKHKGCPPSMPAVVERGICSAACSDSGLNSIIQHLDTGVRVQLPANAALRVQSSGLFSMGRALMTRGLFLEP